MAAKALVISVSSRGFDVTHLDISQGIIDTARQSAQDAGVLDRMRFERDRVGDLTRYESGAFDLVICCDAPISYVVEEKTLASRFLSWLGRKIPKSFTDIFRIWHGAPHLLQT